MAHIGLQPPAVFIALDPTPFLKLNDAIGDRPFLNAEFVATGRGPLLEDRNGTLWYGSDDLYKVSELNGKFTFAPAHLNIPSSPNHPFNIFQLREAPDGCLWLNTNQGVVRRFPDGRRVLYHHETPVRTGLASIVIEPDGRVWVIWRNDFFVINPAPLESVPTNQQLVINPLNPTAVVSTRPGLEISLPTKPDEILQLEETSANSITGRLYQSRDGHIWLIADANLFEFDGRKFLLMELHKVCRQAWAKWPKTAAGNLWIGGRTALARLTVRA